MPLGDGIQESASARGDGPGGAAAARHLRDYARDSAGEAGVRVLHDGCLGGAGHAAGRGSGRALRLRPVGTFSLGQLGWCEAGLCPVFETRVLEDRGEYEVVQDFAGRHVLCFKGRRDGFMPEYVDHPVKDMRTWEEHVQWRLDPASPERYADLEERMDGGARRRAAEG